MLKQKTLTCVQKGVNAFLKSSQNKIKIDIFPPENEIFGHYTTNAAMQLAKIKKQNPLILARSLVTEIKRLTPKDFFEKIEIAPPGFINFWLSQKTFTKEMEDILKSGKRYGGFKKENKKTIIIDYSAPNIAKPMNVGHLRSTIIGQTLANIFRFLGYKVISDNHIGDWGTQFGALIFAWKKWGDKNKFKKNPIDYLVKLYIRFHKAAELNENLIILAREETKKLQQGEKENKKLWQIFVKVSMDEFNKIYKRLEVKFNYTLGESFYQPILKSVVQEALKKGIAKTEDKAIKIFNNEKFKPFVIQKSDGSFLYTTTDLATAKYRQKRWQPEQILYIVANEQTFHFQQIFDAIYRLGYAQKDSLKHIKFGMILGESGKKMSTRKGQFIKLEKLLDKAEKRASKINKKTAEAVGLGAIKYRILSQERNSDIIFDWEQMLNLKGNSGPYLQYAFTRMKSILKKAGLLPKNKDFSLLKKESEQNIIRHLIYFPEIVKRSAETYETNVITNYLFKLASLLNMFYESESILKAEKKLRENRINLIKCATIVFENGLNLLGIKAPNEM
ncbi:arginine--tRNA ligase [Candidatus Wolfebacteria bacterium]|nr:arginine--tRNA ligase [Candidatus Wolfebacteria bacterium]